MCKLFYSRGRWAPSSDTITAVKLRCIPEIKDKWSAVVLLLKLNFDTFKYHSWNWAEISWIPPNFSNSGVLLCLCPPVNSVCPTTLTAWTASEVCWTRPSTANWSTLFTEISRLTCRASLRLHVTSSTSVRKRPKRNTGSHLDTDVHTVLAGRREKHPLKSPSILAFFQKYRNTLCHMDTEIRVDYEKKKKCCFKAVFVFSPCSFRLRVHKKKKNPQLSFRHLSCQDWLVLLVDTVHSFDLKHSLLLFEKLHLNVSDHCFAHVW